MHARFVSTVLLAVAAGGGPAAAAAEPPPLAACLDSDHPPFSSAATPDRGLDVDLARALADKLGRPLQLAWVDVPRRGGLPKALRENFDQGRCNVFFSVPAGGDPPAPRWRPSRPYAVLSYVWAAPPGQPAPSDAAARKARSLGAVTATPADLYLHVQGLPRSPYPNNAALLQALARGDVPAALVWSAALADAQPRPASDGQGPSDAALRTPLTLVSPAADTALGNALDTALAELDADGTLARLAQRHGLPTAATH
ncbi:substrate-binding periplasmic protein [Azohydromonas lata]|uniref:Transporter substrate-binding domain-containing protein n=1 Tax=Azohydromonas lata TaxID=45677 RepID=A0ABU5IPU5_9BURK|nr:transporter substrate-binding domain-containing protein [Azohydromonas lata]MDZ5460905.1 transporter substrate-binding domain-containing protein [Azohydromonas lata]